MLEEAWHWLHINGTSAAQTLGYRREAAALRVRHRRCSKAWRPHIEATRAALLASAARVQLPDARRGSRGSGLVLGAGLPRDVPWGDLLEVFDELVLADVCFHAEARNARRASGGRVKLLTLDVTGVLDELAAHPERIPDLDAAEALLSGPLSDAPRWVASVNLLTQIPLLPCAWLRRHGHAEPALEAFATALSRHHLERLARCPGSLCLVAETADHVRDADGTLIESLPHAALTRLQDNGPEWTSLAHWHWEVNPPGELPAGLTERRDVMALHRATSDG